MLYSGWCGTDSVSNQESQQFAVRAGRDQTEAVKIREEVEQISSTQTEC